MRRQFLLKFLIILGLVCSADQTSKLFVSKRYLIFEDSVDPTIYQGRREVLISLTSDRAWLSAGLTYVRNPGAMGGLFSSMTEPYRLIFLITVGGLSACVFLAIAWRFFALKNQRISLYLMIMVCGAIGNFVDRVRLGYVVDLIYIRWLAFGRIGAIPSFNLADLMIVLSIFLIIKESQKLNSIR